MENFSQKNSLKILSKQTNQTNKKINRVINPTAIASQAISTIFTKDDQTLEAETYRDLKSEIKKVEQGDLSGLEELLVTQTHVLNSLSMQLLIKGSRIIDNPSVLQAMPNYPEKLLKLALKAQSQSRQTVETLAELKNPKKPAQFIKSYVNQQLNQLKLETEAEGQELQQIGESTNAPLDIRSEKDTGSENPTMETVAEFNGTKNSGR